jgi:hypothetical protein
VLSGGTPSAAFDGFGKMASVKKEKISELA